MNEAKSILALSCYLIQRGNYDKERQNETEIQSKPKFKESKIEEINEVKIRHRKRANFQRRKNDKGTEGTDNTESKE